MQTDDRDAFTIPEFCRRHGFSQSHYFALAAAGEGPRVMRVGKRVLISREAAADWRKLRESGQARTRPDDRLERNAASAA
jgi:hypothetical protein